MFKDVNKEDIYYLTSQPNLEKRQFGWNTMDDAQNITWKYIHFIYNMQIIDLYDWFIFIDDDTFVFESRLKKLLKQYNPEDNYYIGKELDHIKSEFCLYMSGGAGYAISKSLYSLIKTYINKIGINNSYNLINLKEQFCDDLCIGLWIQDIAKENNVFQLNNNLFNVGTQNNEDELKTAITFHKVMNEDQFIFYQKIVEEELNEEEKLNEKTENNLVVVLVSDYLYYNKAKRTIIDVRCKGNWKGDIVLITIDFDLNENFKNFYNITEVKFPLIDKSTLLNKIGENGFTNNPDKRELNKLNQWEKLHVFDDYFLKWNRVLYFDCGLRILDDIKYIENIDCQNKIIAPKDGKLFENTEFIHQISFDNKELIEEFKKEYGENILNSNFMLNCMWIYDTKILKFCDKNQLIEAMNKYTFCKNNEMVIMNLLFHYKYKLWERLPIMAPNGKIFFDWSELNNSGTNWKDYCFIKYPVGISFEDT